MYTKDHSVVCKSKHKRHGNMSCTSRISNVSSKKKYEWWWIWCICQAHSYSTGLGSGYVHSECVCESSTATTGVYCGYPTQTNVVLKSAHLPGTNSRYTTTNAITTLISGTIRVKYNSVTFGELLSYNSVISVLTFRVSFLTIASTFTYHGWRLVLILIHFKSIIQQETIREGSHLM